MPFALLYLVFHRILDFKTGLDFYLGPFLFNEKGNSNSMLLVASSAIQNIS